MREQHNTLKQLMWEYQTVKAGLVSSPSVMPKEDQDFQKQYSGIPNQSARENKHAFIADVEEFARDFDKDSYRPIPFTLLLKIFHFALCPALTGKCDTFGKLRQHFINCQETMKVPKRILNRGNLYAIVMAMQNKAEDYYREKGMIAENNYYMAV